MVFLYEECLVCALRSGQVKRCPPEDLLAGRDLAHHFRTWAQEKAGRRYRIFMKVVSRPYFYMQRPLAAFHLNS